MAIEMEKGSVSIDAQNIMPVIKRWLYSDKDIFLREVVSNGCDAITKYRMTNPDDESEMSVMVTVDKENKTLTISDTGIGMTEDEVKRYINQVAFSGASEFMKKFEGDEKKGDIIGHFGLGFYSVFMVSENVEIETLSCQEGAEPVHWESKDGMDFAISEGHRTTHGTSIILHISDEEKEFLELYRVREVLTRYCGYMAYPIYLMDANAKPVEREEEIPGETNEDGTPKKRKVVDEPKPSLINDTKPLWLKKPSECEDKEYIDFYHKMFGWEDPLFWVHLNVDYPFNLKGILYFPRIRKDFGGQEGQIKLFNRQVFVADNIKEIIPEDSPYTCDAPNPQTVTISAGQTAEVTFTNRMKPGEIRIQKTDTHGESLAGAEFLLEWSKDGRQWQTVTYTDSPDVTEGTCTAEGLTDGKLTSGADGEVRFTGLYSGSLYRVTETKAPKGYQLLTEPVYEGGIRKDDGNFIRLTVVNAPVFELPMTGSTGYTAMTAIQVGTGVVLLFILIWLAKKRK